MIRISKHLITEVVSICPYCYGLKKNKFLCCDEHHFEDAYLLDDGSLYLCSESEVEDDTKIEPDMMSLSKERVEIEMCKEVELT